MNFVLLTQSDIKDPHGIKILQDLAKAPGGLVLMFPDVKEDGKVKIPKEDLPRKMYKKEKCSYNERGNTFSNHTKPK